MNVSSDRPPLRSLLSLTTPDQLIQGIVLSTWTTGWPDWPDWPDTPRRSTQKSGGIPTRQAAGPTTIQFHRVRECLGKSGTMAAA